MAFTERVWLRQTSLYVPITFTTTPPAERVLILRGCAVGSESLDMGSPDRHSSVSIASAYPQPDDLSTQAARE